MRSLARILRSLAALLVLVALLVGIPAALLFFYGNPLPTRLPDAGEIGALLTSRNTIGFFVFLVVWVGWIAWATFALSVVLEVIARLRGGHAPRIPGLGLQQGAAALLLSALLGGLALSSAGGLAPSGGSAGAAADGAQQSLAPHAVTSDAAGADSSAESASARTGGPGQAVAHGAAANAEHSAQEDRAVPGASEQTTVVVRSGDSLWSLAQRHLGDGQRWSEIAEANYDRVQPDGGSLQRGDMPYLEPGWVLVLPGVGTADIPSTAAGPTGTTAHSADAADPLQDDVDAQRQEQARQIAAQRNEHAAQMHRAEQEARQVREANAQREAAEQGGADGSAGTSAVQDQHGAAADADRPVVSTDTDAAPAGTDDGSTDEPSSEQPEPDQPAEEGPVAAGEEGPASAGPFGSHAAPWAGIGSLLAAAVLGAARPRRAAGRAGTGEEPESDALDPRIPFPDELARADVDPEAPLFLDLALRALAGLQAHDGAPMPDVHVAMLSPTHLELVCATPMRLPAPFETSGDATRWRLPRTSPVVLDQDLVAMPAPYPALVPLGTASDGNLLLVDLERLTALGIDAPADLAPGTVDALAASLAALPWTAGLAISTIALDLEEETGTTAPGRLTQHRTVADYLENVAAREEDGTPTTGEVLLVGTDVTDLERSRLHDLVADPTRHLALVEVGGAGTGAATPSPWRMSVTSEREAHLEPLGVALQPQRLTATETTCVLRVVDPAQADVPRPRLPDPATLGPRGGTAGDAVGRAEDDHVRGPVLGSFGASDAVQGAVGTTGDDEAPTRRLDPDIAAATRRVDPDAVAPTRRTSPDAAATGADATAATRLTSPAEPPEIAADGTDDPWVTDP